MNKSHCIKLKSFCTAKEIITRLETSHRMGENLPILLIQQGLISIIYRELKKLSLQRINIPMKKWAHELNSKFSKEEVQMASRYMKKYSTSLVIKEMQSKQHLGFISLQLERP
jgi:hypothetical protein